MNTPTVTIRVERKFAVPAERVFEAWLDPRLARQWLFATPTGQIVKAEIDARVGGQFTMTDRRGNDDVEHVGEYLEIDRPRRLLFTFSVPMYSKLSTRVSIDIAPSGSGCALTLTHEGVLPEYEERSVEGWTKLLQSLARVVE